MPNENGTPAKKTPAPSAPDSREAVARARVDELLQLSEDILAKSGQPDLPELGQMILRRGRLMEEIRALGLDSLPAASHATLREKLLRCQTLDETIEANLTGYKDVLGNQLKGLKGNKALMNKYSATLHETIGHHTEEA